MSFIEMTGAMLERIIAGTRPFDFLLWRMISFGAWMRVFSLRT